MTEEPTWRRQSKPEQGAHYQPYFMVCFPLRRDPEIRSWTQVVYLEVDFRIHNEEEIRKENPEKMSVNELGIAMDNGPQSYMVYHVE